MAKVQNDGFVRALPDAISHLKKYDFIDPSAGLKNGEGDCGIFRPPLDFDYIESPEIAREKCVVCLPTGHRLETMPYVMLEDIIDEPIIAAPARHLAIKLHQMNLLWISLQS